MHYRATLTEDAWIRYPEESEFQDWMHAKGTEGWASPWTKQWWTFYPDEGDAISVYDAKVDVDFNNFVEPVYTLQERFYGLEEKA